MPSFFTDNFTDTTSQATVHAGAHNAIADVLNGQTPLLIGPSFMPLYYGKHIAGDIGGGSDFQIQFEQTSDSARIIDIRFPRFYLSDGTNTFSLTTNGWTGTTLNTSLSLVCITGSFAALAASGNLTINQVAYGSGVISYGSVTGSGGVGTTGTLNTTALVSGTISPANTDISERYGVNLGDAFGAKIWRIANAGGEELNDQYTFRYAAIGSTSLFDICIGYFDPSGRSTGSAMFYGTDGTFGTASPVYTWRVDSGGFHQYRVTAGSETMTFAPNIGIFTSTPLNIGTSTQGWNIGFIAEVRTTISEKQTLMPANWLAETMDRRYIASYTVPAPVTGLNRLTEIYLTAGVPVSNLHWMSGSTVATLPSHWGLALYDQNRVMLATTADQGATALIGSHLYIIPIANVAAGAAASFTPTYSGMHYIGRVEVTSGGSTSLYAGVTSTTVNTPALAIPPIATGISSDSALTTWPPAFPHTAGSLTASEMVYLGCS